MAAIEDWHIVLLSHLINSSEETQEILLGVDILLTVSAQKDILTFLQTQTLVDIAGLNLSEVLMEHLGHRTACDIGAFLGQTTVGQIATGMLRVRHIHIRNNIDDATVGLLGQALVLTTIASLHVEDGDMQALGTNHAQTGVGIAQYQHCIGLGLDHHLIRLVDDITHRAAEVIPHSLHVDIRIGEFEVLEEHPVEVVVVVLTGMGQQTVEILPTLIDHRRQTNNLRPRTYDDEQFQFAIVLKMLYFHFTFLPFYFFTFISPGQNKYPGNWGRTIRWPT